MRQDGYCRCTSDTCPHGAELLKMHRTARPQYAEIEMPMRLAPGTPANLLPSLIGVVQPCPIQPEQCPLRPDGHGTGYVKPAQALPLSATVMAHARMHLINTFLHCIVSCYASVLQPRQCVPITFACSLAYRTPDLPYTGNPSPCGIPCSHSWPFPTRHHCSHLLPP